MKALLLLKKIRNQELKCKIMTHLKSLDVQRLYAFLPAPTSGVEFVPPPRCPKARQCFFSGRKATSGLGILHFNLITRGYNG